MIGSEKILFDAELNSWQFLLGKRRKCRGRSHEWQPEWVGSSVPGATIYKPSRTSASGALSFVVARSSGQSFTPYPMAVPL